MSSDVVTSELPPVAKHARERLHQPWRVWIALGELVAAGGAIWGAFALWGMAITTMTMRLDDGTELVSREYAGNWIALALVLGAVAGLLVIDAVRQVLLGTRTRRRRRKSRDDDEVVSQETR